MLQNLHNRIQGWIAGSIIALIAGAFTLWGLESYLQSHANDHTKAEVNGAEISKNQVQAEYQRLQATAAENAKKYGIEFNLTNRVVKILKLQALEALIHNLVLVQAAEAAGFNVAQAQVDKIITEIPYFQVDGKFSAAQFSNVAARMQYHPDEYTQFIRDNVIKNQLLLGVETSAFTLPNEQNTAISLLKEKRDIKYIVIDTAKLKNFKPADAKQLAEYYKNNQAKFKTAEKVQLAYLKLDINDLMRDVKLTDQEVLNYYTENQDSYKTPAQWQVAHILLRVPENADKAATDKIEQQAEAILKQLNAGKDFATLAKKKSQDTLTARKGGTLPEMSVANMPVAYQPVLAKLTRPGEISDVFKTDYGYEIVKCLKYQASKQKPFAAVKDKLRKLMIRKRANKAFSDKAEQLANLSFSNPDTLSVAAEALGLKVRHTDWFTRNGLKTGIASKPQIINAAFSDDVLSAGNNSSNLQVSDEAIVVIRVSKHEPAKVKPLAEVKSKIQAVLTKQAKYQQALTIAKAIVADIKAGKSGSDLIAKHHLAWKAAKQITRQDKKLDPAIVELSFALPQTIKLNQHIAKTSLKNDDVAVVQLQKVVAGSGKDLTKPETASMQQGLATARGALEYKIYVNSKLQAADIVRTKK